MGARETVELLKAKTQNSVHSTHTLATKQTRTTQHGR